MFTASVRELVWAYQESQEAFVVISQSTQRSPSQAAPLAQQLQLAQSFSHTGLEVSLLPRIPGALLNQASARKLCDL